MGKIRYVDLIANPHYDGDSAKLFEHDSLTRHVDGSVAKPSLTTVLNYLAVENRKQRPKAYNPQEEWVDEIGFYPLDGRKPFISTSDHEPNCELTYSNNNEFAFAVATRLLMEYRMGNKTNHTAEEILEKN